MFDTHSATTHKQPTAGAGAATVRVGDVTHNRAVGDGGGGGGVEKHEVDTATVVVGRIARDRTASDDRRPREAAANPDATPVGASRVS